LKDVSIKVGDNLTSVQTCAYYRGPPEELKVLQIYCRQTGQYVMVAKTNSADLCLCEVEVYGYLIT